MKKYLKIARPDHWIKQLFILPGVWLAWVMAGLGDQPWAGILLGLLATSLAASANYVINEWLDAEFDKYHPVKKNRPADTWSSENQREIKIKYYLCAVKNRKDYESSRH